MRLYIHNGENTVLAKVKDTDTVADTLSSLSVSPSSSVLSLSPLPQQPSLPNNAIISSLVEDKADLFLHHRLPRPSSHPSSLLPLLQHAESIEAQDPRKAMVLYQRVIDSDPASAPAQLRLGLLFLKVGRFKDALLPLQTAHKLEEKADVLPLAQCYFKLGQYHSALQHAHISLLLQAPHSHLPSHFAPKQVSHCLQEVLRTQSPTDQAIIETLLLMAEILYELSPSLQGISISILEKLLPFNSQHPGVLLAYSKVAIKRNMAVQTIPFLLRALVSKPSVEVKKLLAQISLGPNGVQQIHQQLLTAQTSPEALSYMGHCIKEQGAIGPAVKFYKMAATHLPENSNLHLLLVHSIESLCKLQDCFDTGKAFLRLKDTTFGSMSVQKFVDVFDLADDIRSPKFHDGTFSLLQREEVMTLESSRQYWDYTKLQSHIPHEEITSYVPEQIEILGILMTLTKVLYLSGAVHIVPTLINMIEPLRKDQNLHLTSIRNENAYFGCVAALVGQAPFPVQSDLKPVYICGDSHCLSLAWHTINIKEEKYIVHPKLATGVKIWHLRPESSFYPKANFEFALKSIPDGSTVILSVGEIDCRESMPRVVEKCKYDTLEEAIESTVDIYVQVVLNIQKNRDLNIYVHPIPPVMDITRQVVLKFNAVLKTKMEAASLKFLDFADSLLLDGALDPKCSLDGTHMSPAYLPLLEKAIAAFES